MSPIARAARAAAAATAFLVVGATTDAAAQAHQHDILGTVDFPISCAPPAQAEFNRAVALLHHMTYPAARAAFEQVARLDPRCAMTHWGVAMTLFQPLWPTRPTPADLRRGWDAVETARRLAPGSERERLLIDAAAAFFRDPESTDYWQRLRRWEAEMSRAHATLPSDPEIAALYALAHLAIAPNDTGARAHADRAAALLIGVYERNPDHPGAMHYLVHANDVPGRERELLEITRKYDRAAPRNPHALHMPTHIYVRLGEWDGVIRGNQAAADAALEQPAGDSGQFVWDEFPHAIEYLVYAQLQQGADADAARQLERMRGTARLEPTFKTAFHLASTSARYALERHAWSDAAALVPREPAALPWDRFMWPEAVIWFAKGLGAAHEGNSSDARAAADRLARLEANATAQGEELFARNIRVLLLEVRAWAAHAEGDTAAGVALLREAAELEQATPKHAVTPGPVIPGWELLGDMLLAQSRPGDALAAYERSLRLYPRRFNGLLGAARAARAAGDRNIARTRYRELLEVAGGQGRRAALDEARRFASTGR